MEYIICHYNEIGLKGKNRKIFENKLVGNIKAALNDVHPVKRGKAAILSKIKLFNRVKRISGRIIIELKDSAENQKKEITKKLEKIFGLAYFCFAQESKQNLKEIQKKGKELLSEEKFNSFCVRAQRSNKKFPFISVDIEKKVGAFLLKSLKKKVDLSNPEITLFIEIVENYAFLYTKKISGLGGLPVGTAGRANCLLSDGIDSPVAAWQMMKRGLEVIFIHFYAYSKNEKQSLEKIKKIVKVLNQYQLKSKLYLVPFKNVQKQIFRKQENRYCCLICKRAMFKIAERVAKKENCFTLITGDSLGQVASQTLENMRVIDSATDLFVLRPLVGFDKQETIEIAKKIGTYDLSIIPSKFYCYDFLPKHPVTKSNLEIIKNIEEKIKINRFVKEIINKAKIEKF